jgi:hypothetical protein
MPPQLLAGAATVVITPPVGLDLCGFGGRPGPSEAVHDGPPDHSIRYSPTSSQ